jgi:hypothetical protein
MSLVSSLRRTFPLVLAIFVVALVALYPYFGAMDMCEMGECPYAMTPSSSGNSAGPVSACIVAALAASFAGMLAPALLRGRRVFANSSWATQFHLAPDSPPPRFSSF